MWRFFYTAKWLPWSILGTLTIIRSWLSIVELISVYKRLREFESQFK